jgi:hypothetical protein
VAEGSRQPSSSVGASAPASPGKGQVALLRLILLGGRDYADIAALLDTDVEGVRERAREALATLAGEDPDEYVGLTDFLLGQADEQAGESISETLNRDARANELAERLAIELRQIAPEADFPPTSRTRQVRASPFARWREIGRGLSTRNRVAIGGGIAALVIVIASQAAIPTMAANSVRDRLQDLGPVKELSMSTPFPAIGVLVGAKPGRVDAHLGEVDVTESPDFGSQLSDGAAEIDDGHLLVDQLRGGPVPAKNVDLQKDGSSLNLSADLEMATLGSALGMPSSAKVKFKPAGRDQISLSVALGAQGSMGVRIYAEGGGLLAQVDPGPQIAAAMGLPEGISIPPQPLIESDRFSIDSIEADENGDLVRVSANGRLKT